jgi:hypothetical protein
MLRRVIGPAVLAISAFVTASVRQSNGLVVHEWGTFTTVAGADGKAIDWLPLGAPSDLPCFVERYNRSAFVKVMPNAAVAGTVGQSKANGAASVPYQAARADLPARVRMETPVLYFYSNRDTTVHVRVKFHRGLMTEWYPPAVVSQAIVGASTLRDPRQASSIEWPSVRITPTAATAFPVERGESHYYAARNTDASPVVVGGQKERFLFYRGVADFDVPLAATIESDGAIRVRNLSSAEIPAVVLFERRGSTIGFRLAGSLSTEQRIAAPALDGSLDGLRRALEQTLVSAGLTSKEAAAMVETWRDSWFEEGTRVFYVVPQSLVDEILPLEVVPAPAQVTRVFVGRMEVVTPATERAVRAAVDQRDQPALERYGRFLGPISDRILATTRDAGAAARIRDVTNAAFASYLRRTVICE